MQIPAIEECRPEVIAFARLMEAKLRENDHKGGWKNWSPGEAHRRLLEEAAELEREIYPPTCACRGFAECEHNTAWWRPVPMRVGREAADVANFAMMIADMAGALKQL